MGRASWAWDRRGRMGAGVFLDLGRKCIVFWYTHPPFAFIWGGAFTVQMQNGKVQVVWPPEVATGKLAWPSPSWQQ